MSGATLERLLRKYYGYVADLEGSGVEVLDLLFIRDKIQSMLDQLTPDEAVPAALYTRVPDHDGGVDEDASYAARLASHAQPLPLLLLEVPIDVSLTALPPLSPGSARQAMASHLAAPAFSCYRETTARNAPRLRTYQEA